MTQQEFGQYVQANYDQLYRFVLSRLHKPQDAEDVLQKALLRLLLICHNVNADAPDGFVFTALRNGIIDFWRARGRRPAEAELDRDVGAAPAAPAADDAAEELAVRLVRAAAAGLTPRERQAFAAYWQARGDRAEALAVLGLTDAAKEEKYRVYDGPLYHAKRKLGAALQAHWDELAEIGEHRVWDLVSEVLAGADR
jgi:RNA polymerase sigma factor (sigma-70 family)